MSKSNRLGGKSRKHGRCKASPAHKRYTAERRWFRHKVNRIVRYVRRHPRWQLPSTLDPEVRTRVCNLLQK